MLAILASTLTTVAVFLPIGFVPGMVGEIFLNLALTIVFSLAASYLVAIMVVPLMASRIIKVSGEVSHPLMDRVAASLSRLLGFLLRSPVRCVGYFVIVLAVFGVSLMFFPPQEFFPSMDRGTFVVSFETPEGTSVEQTDLITAAIERQLRTYPEVEKLISRTEMAEGSITVVLKPVKQRKRTTADIISASRAEISRIPGFTDIFYNEMRMGPPQSGKPISIQVSGEKFEQLEEICLMIAGKISSVKGLKDLNNGVKKGRPEIKIEFDREKIRDLGINLAGISGMVRSFVYGTVAGKYKESNEEYDIRVEADDPYKDRIEKVRNMQFTIDKGVRVTLSQIARIYQDRGYSQIERSNLKKILKVEADSEGRAQGLVISDIQKILSTIELPQGYEAKFGGEEEDRAEAFGNLGYALIAAVCLVYMVMAAQFESFLYPFVIMFTIPLSVIGVVLSLRLSGYAFSVTAMIGIIMLAGIVVNNGIILIDYINRRRTLHGENRIDACLTACTVRMRPIMMTTMTTVCGMLPLALGIGAGADFFQPLAITVIGGLIFSMVLTLTFIPVTYTIVDTGREWAARLMFGRK
ncbi:MAG: efflux RND transporter permease subunit, partial [Candidatus Wallbacteria bacterium]|nr:efflux RND transporter permease subunit [Candidatus Wallbacteria bacterium]